MLFQEVFKHTRFIKAWFMLIKIPKIPVVNNAHREGFYFIFLSDYLIVFWNGPLHCVSLIYLIFFSNSFCGFCPREIYVWLTIHKRHGRTHSFKVIETSNINMIPWQLLALFHIHGYWYFSERNQLRDPQRYLNAGYIFFTCNVATFISRWITKESNLLFDYIQMKRRMFYHK